MRHFYNLSLVFECTNVLILELTPHDLWYRQIVNQIPLMKYYQSASHSVSSAAGVIHQTLID